MTGTLVCREDTLHGIGGFLLIVARGFNGQRSAEGRAEGDDAQDVSQVGDFVSRPKEYCRTKATRRLDQVGGWAQVQAVGPRHDDVGTLHAAVGLRALGDCSSLLSVIFSIVVWPLPGGGFEAMRFPFQHPNSVPLSMNDIGEETLQHLGARSPKAIMGITMTLAALGAVPAILASFRGASWGSGFWTVLWVVLCFTVVPSVHHLSRELLRQRRQIAELEQRLASLAEPHFRSE